MTETLLLKIVNGSTDINEVIKWLSWDEKACIFIFSNTT